MADDGVPYRFDRTATAADLHARFDGDAPGWEDGPVESVAGRVLLCRRQGRLSFATLADSSGTIQLFAQLHASTGYSALQEARVGDWVGVRGRLMKTRRGELSVNVEELAILARPLRPWPDKWHGLTDVDTRYRQRYVDLWLEPEARRVAVLRARAVSLTRRWLEDRGFLEVETPILEPIAGGATARPFVTTHNALDMELYLRIAIELRLKRLVVGGIEKVFEIGRVFRNEGMSPRHNPEFTMLELYEAYADYRDMMALTEQLVAHLATELCGTTTLTYQGRELDVAPPWRRATMAELVEEQAGVRVDVGMDVDELRRIAADHGVRVEPAWGPGKLVLEIYEKTTESALWGPVFVCDYPQEVSPLARAHREVPGLVERFEAVVAGRELCNAFSELVDPVEQRARFEEQARQRAAGDAEAMLVDEDYLRALEYGLPPTGGLGVGIDRLAMLLADTPNIRDVVLFPTMRPEQRAGDREQQGGAP
ncbi:MAG TPA: lysine--tRNA ligase [Acidimicrobiales bacterium]